MSVTPDIDRPGRAFKHRRRLAIASLGVAGLALVAVMAGGIGRNLVYYWGPTELRAAGAQANGATIRLGGLVVPGSVHQASDSSPLEFDVTDATTIVHVRSRGVTPPMFREGIGVVVEGTMTPTGSFESTRLLVKHGNDYQAPVDGQPVDMPTLMKSSEGLRRGKP